MLDMTEPLHILRHSTLGEIVGVHTHNGTYQYRNIPYASISGRWDHSQLRDGPLGAKTAYDATKWGPMAPQLPDSIAIDFDIIQKELPFNYDLEVDEYKCLNLVVTTPVVTRDEKLPVLFM